MSPDFSRGFLRLPLSVWLTIFCQAPLTRRQLQLVAVVIRESWGWRTASGAVQEWTRPLTTRQFAKATGLSSDHLRADLCRLIERRVLYEQSGRYRFQCDPRLWTAASRPPQLSRSQAQNATGRDATLADPDLALKKGQRKQRDVAAAPDRGLSTPGENSSRRSLAFGSPTASAGISAEAASRLADIVAAFVGTLSTVEAETLRDWIAEVGIARVWQSLEPSFRLGSRQARRYLLAVLASRQKGQGR